ncbi:vWA domain-containing protein [Nocardia goodfellowii]|uniref:Ca-activated chloride channel family protein n=1 Tax=Nocardia goodfellowii TaxID=882446 RepID=A0ABS4QKG0_9NOCA|nr:VWA domain-containing protein [Nocardia goodfellowii]MBP2192195.1 Ca-activated chloride channel family protein [Nocardia goodfellowii]
MSPVSRSFSAKLIGLAAAGVVGLLPGAAPAWAQESPGGQDNPEYAPTMLVLDASGSMLAADPGGGTKMDAAKTAVRNFVTAAPSAAKVGLTVYGTGTGSTDAEKSAGCQDVKVLRPAGTIDKSALTGAVDQITPSGFTPIGAALRKAAESLPREGRSSIVLVSDGLDTCSPPDPCEVAREVGKQGHQIVMHAIGFGVDAASRTQLTCIAQTTGGTYTDAADGSTLEQVLPRVSATALRNYAPAGTRVQGTERYRDAPVVTPGQYLDVLNQKSRRYYAVDIPEGSTAYFSGTVSFPRRTSGSSSSVNRLDLRVFGRDGDDCNVYENESQSRSGDGAALTVGTVFTKAAEPKTGSPSTDRCRGGGRYYFTLEWAHVGEHSPETLTLEMNVGLEAPVSDAGPAPAATTPVEFETPTTPVQPVVGGGSFNVATTLNGSGLYSDTLQRGEFVFYKVKLEWGQGLAYRVHFGATNVRGSAYTSNVSTTLYTPFRTEIDDDTTAYTSSDLVLPANDPAVATIPIRYRNREADVVKLREQSVAGWYYIAVKLSPGSEPEQARGVPVPIEVELSVSGSPEPGPTYRSTGTPAETFGGNGESATEGPGAQAASSSESEGISPMVLAAGGAVLILVVGAPMLFLMLRRRGKR